MPARDEVHRIGRLLEALAAQDRPGGIPVVVALNNTTDGSRYVIDDAAARYRGRLDILLDEHVFPEELAHAGSARRRAMDLGYERLGGQGVLLATDADARPPSNWISANLKAIAAGADIVGGALALDDAEPAAASLLERWELLARYWETVRAIEDEVDPKDWDPAPRHGDHTGASLAVTAKAYRACGGVPVVPIGEDVALVNAVVAGGGCLRHPAEVQIKVSPRLVGRAAGGMAEAMVALAGDPQRPRSLMAPSFEHWRARAAWRRELRSRPDGNATIARLEPALPPMPCDMALEAGPVR
ncbi:glycosyltransferase [Methylopila sp. M107]|uniref:glycosyltransferase n=1 Tax=Methylopila sp. M107 TaxID=1101190 RepID=UPI0018CA0311|nr:glycosyltransferase [Methylopila sp. M107]